MDLSRQKKAPIYEALERFRKLHVVPFDVPGHKRGRGNPELVNFLGQQCIGVDVNSMKPLDNLCHPTSIIKEAEELAADAFSAAHSFLMVGGTTSAVQAMVLTACKAGDKIILPRNVHKSAINALVLCVDEKSQLQALDRTQPLLPLRPGKPKRLTATYKRNGTTCLLAALSVHEGKVEGRCVDSTNHMNYLNVLRHLYRIYPGKELHIIADNLSSHKHKDVLEWVKKRRRL